MIEELIVPLGILLSDPDICEVGSQTRNAQKHLPIVQVVSSHRTPFRPLPVDIAAFNLIASKLTVTINAAVGRENMRTLLSNARNPGRSKLVRDRVLIRFESGKSQVWIGDRANPGQAKQDKNA